MDFSRSQTRFLNELKESILQAMQDAFRVNNDSLRQEMKDELRSNNDSFRQEIRDELRINNDLLLQEMRAMENRIDAKAEKNKEEILGFIDERLLPQIDDLDRRVTKLEAKPA